MTEARLERAAHARGQSGGSDRVDAFHAASPAVRSFPFRILTDAFYSLSSCCLFVGQLEPNVDFILSARDSVLQSTPDVSGSIRVFNDRACRTRVLVTTKM